MKNFSNTYIFLFSAVLVIVVAAVLSFVSESLRPIQQLNVEIEKKQDILRSVGQAQEYATVEDKNTYILDLYAKYIKSSIVVNSKGELVEGRDAFDITKDLKNELTKPVEERGLPIFIYEDEAQTKRYVVPMRGKGLWGPIWGYVSVNDDYTTIFGTVFDHVSETPGLGAEIREIWFQKEFQGKRIFDETGKFVSVEVVKGGVSDDNLYAVDAVSGGTITSKGLQFMLHDCLLPYENYFKSNMKKN
jgi:Na+-transporting NADH:ubiquinone oxidoreductase subunit C